MKEVLVHSGIRDWSDGNIEIRDFAFTLFDFNAG